MKPTESDSNLALVEALNTKIDACWCINKYEQGSANMHKIAEYLYYSLYGFDGAKTRVPLTEYFPGCIEGFVRNICGKTIDTPSIDEFIAEIKRSLLSDINYQLCLYPGALDAVTAILQHNRVTIWSSGDVNGFPERGIPGSGQQLSKITKSGIVEAAEIVARERGVSLAAIFSLVALEDKMLPLPELINTMQKRGVTRVVLLDDVRINLEQATKLVHSRGLETMAYCVQPKQNSIKKHRTDQGGPIYIYSITDVARDRSLLSHPNQEFLIDFDGVIADDDRRAELHKVAILSTLQSHNWI